MKSLPPLMVRLCNRLPAEQTKASTWMLCQQLWEEYAARLAEGESMSELEADIQVRVIQAAREQFDLTTPSTKHTSAICASQKAQFPKH